MRWTLSLYAQVIFVWEYCWGGQAQFLWFLHKQEIKMSLQVSEKKKNDETSISKKEEPSSFLSVFILKKLSMIFHLKII